MPHDWIWFALVVLLLAPWYVRWKEQQEATSRSTTWREYRGWVLICVGTGLAVFAVLDDPIDEMSVWGSRIMLGLGVVLVLVGASRLQD